MSEIENEVEHGVHNYSSESEWVKPEDQVILERLEWFKDQKLALMMHWGPYSQLGLVESWMLGDENGDWARNDIDWTNDYEEMKRENFALNKTFNPIRFQPEVWADVAAEGGFKNLIFTTKHHDGFCMWDRHTTDYRITGKIPLFMRTAMRTFANKYSTLSMPRGWPSPLTSPKRTGTLHIIGRRAWSGDGICGADLPMIRKRIRGCGRSSWSLPMSKSWNS